MSGSRLTRQEPPSWLWGVTESKRQEILSKKDANGRPYFKLVPVPVDEVLKRPVSSNADLRGAKLALLSELAQDPISTSCEACGRPMSPERSRQRCESCHKTLTQAAEQ